MKKNTNKQSNKVTNKSNNNITNNSNNNNKVTDCNKSVSNKSSNSNNVTDLGFADDDETESFHLDTNDEHSFELR